MWIVHPPSVCLGEDNIFELSLGVLGWTLLSPKYMYLGRGSHFFHIPMRAIRLSPATYGPPIMVNTSLILSGLYY